MPNKNNNRKRKNKSKNGVSRTGLQAGILEIFPLRLRTKLPYSDLLSLTATSGSASFGTETSYRLASLFDPYFSLGGHQPYGFDQITPFYNKYLVMKCKIRLTFSDPSGDGMFVGVFVKSYTDNATLTGCTIGQATERPNVWLSPLNNTGSQKVTYVKEIDCARMVGLTRNQYEGAFTHTGAAITTDPNTTPYLSISVCDSNGTNPAPTCRVLVELIFDAVFFERVMPAQS